MGFLKHQQKYGKVTERTDFYAEFTMGGDKAEKIIPGIARVVPPSMMSPPYVSYDHVSEKDTYDRVKKYVFEKDDPYHRLAKDLEHFLENKKYFTEHGVLYRRGFLLHGPPGTGKTAIGDAIQSLWVKQHKGIVINGWDYDINDNFGLGQMWDILHKWGAVDSGLPILLHIDEFDEYVADNRRKNDFSYFLEEAQDLVLVCTTNYMDKLPERFIKRPGRFDRRILIDSIGYTPLFNLCREKGLDEKESDAVAKQCSRISIAAVTEIAVRMKCFNYSLQEAIDTVKAEFFPEQVGTKSLSKSIDDSNTIRRSAFLQDDKKVDIDRLEEALSGGQKVEAYDPENY